MIGASDPRHFVLVKHLLDESLRFGVDLHEADVGDVDEEQQQGLPPLDELVAEKDDEGDEGHGVEGAVPEQRPPGQVQHSLGEQRAHPDHEQNVEDRRTHDRADAHVGKGHEHADDRSKEFRRGPAGRHECSTGHVFAAADHVDDDIQRRHEELIADDGQRHEHVDEADDVEDDGAFESCVPVEEVRGEEGVSLLLGGRGRDLDPALVIVYGRQVRLDRRHLGHQVSEEGAGDLDVLLLLLLLLLLLHRGQGGLGEESVSVGVFQEPGVMVKCHEADEVDGRNGHVLADAGGVLPRAPSV